MRQIRFLFINAVNPYSEVQSRFPNLGYGYLAAILRKRFSPGQFTFKVVSRNVEEEIKSFRPTIIGIGSVTQNFNYAKQYAHLAKEYLIPVIMGGPHISALPNNLTPDMDVAVLGEGEETVSDLMQLFLEDDYLPPAKLEEIPGLAFRHQDGRLLLSPPREPISNLDDLPFPDRSLYRIASHTNVFSSRGCPYRCQFCFSSRYWDKLRFFSADYVIEELRFLVRTYGVKRISFYDDLMIADRGRLEELVVRIRRDNELSKLKFWLNARANLITPGSAALMQEMGVVSVGMGLESGCERTLKYLKGGSVTVQDNLNAIKILHQWNIAANASFIIGSPDETRSEIIETLNFIKKSKLNFADTYVLVPFPGTPVWEDAKTRGIVSDDMDWDRLNFYHRKQTAPVLVSRTITHPEMGKLYAKFARARYLRALRTAWTHPFFFGMVKAGLNILKIAVRRGINACLGRRG